MECRICREPAACRIARYRTYLDYRTELFDCEACGCRFAPRDAGVYERLHDAPNSTYAVHGEWSTAVKGHFDMGEVDALRAVLAKQAKNRHIIGAAAELPRGARVLEVGCSLGHLTSWFIASGFDVTAVDTSRTAIDKARALFGPRFFLDSDPVVDRNAPYDFIYHAGTIGCVNDPIGLTRRWLSMLRPNGILVFNAPNRGLADAIGKVWPHTTRPPDLVTLFPREFFGLRFASEAEVTTREEYLSRADALVFQALPPFIIAGQPYLMRRERALSLLLGATRKLARAFALLLCDGSDSTIPAEFGLMVTMRKRTTPA